MLCVITLKKRTLMSKLLFVIINAEDVYEAEVLPDSENTTLNINGSALTFSSLSV